MGKMTVQMSLRIDPEEYDRFKAAAEKMGLSVPMWLVKCGQAGVIAGRIATAVSEQSATETP